MLALDSAIGMQGVPLLIYRKAKRSASIDSARCRLLYRNAQRSAALEPLTLSAQCVILNIGAR